MDTAVLNFEIKALALEKIIEMRKELAEFSEDLGVWCLFDVESGILIQSTEEFLKYAKYFKEVVTVKKKTAVGTLLRFCHMNTEIRTYVSEAEMNELLEVSVWKLC